MSYSFFNILGKNQTARCHTGDPLPIAGRSPLLVPLRDPRLVLLRDPLLVLQGEPSQGPSSRPPQGLPSYPSGGPPTHSHRPSSRTSQGPSTLPSQTSTSGYFQTVASRPHEPPSPLQGFNSQGSPSLLEESPSRPRHESAPCPTEIPSHLDETPADIPPDVVNGWACVVTQDWDSRDHTLPQGLVPGLKVIKGDEVWVFRTNQRYGLVHRPHGATYLRGWVTVDVLQKGVQRVDPLPIELPQETPVFKNPKAEEPWTSWYNPTKQVYVYRTRRVIHVSKDDMSIQWGSRMAVQIPLKVGQDAGFKHRQAVHLVVEVAKNTEGEYPAHPLRFVRFPPQIGRNSELEKLGSMAIMIQWLPEGETGWKQYYLERRQLCEHISKENPALFIYRMAMAVFCDVEPIPIALAGYTQRCHQRSISYAMIIFNKRECWTWFSPSV
ncbi:hypothetical protein NW753_007714 [Fusarium oxysporum]|nr:hypothetical protein NW753_007714 [Fusarium oxysporum]KAJ4114196.1 hypothetical protein NW769_004979 [Fusarium oxysporum]